MADENLLCKEHLIHPDQIHLAEDKMPDSDTLFEVAELFKLFGDHTRIRIICALYAGEMCVCDLAQLLNMGQSAISHQLRLLKAARLIRVQRRGRSAFYSLDDDHIHAIVGQGIEHVMEERKKV